MNVWNFRYGDDRVNYRSGGLDSTEVKASSKNSSVTHVKAE